MTAKQRTRGWTIWQPRPPGVVLAGDAAGYFDPFTGQGIYRALVCNGWSTSS